MPVRELYFKLRKQGCSRRQRLVKKHLVITGCVIMGMWVTGELVGWLLTQTRILNSNQHNLLRVAPLLLTLATLGVVYMGLHVLRFCMIAAKKMDGEN